MKKTIVILMAAASLTMANVNAADNDLTNADMQKTLTAAQNDAIDWYTAHHNVQFNDEDLMQIGEGRALKRGVRGFNVTVYEVTFRDAVTAQRKAEELK
jgi:hypothetical protein